MSDALMIDLMRRVAILRHCTVLPRYKRDYDPKLYTVKPVRPPNG